MKNSASFSEKGMTDVEPARVMVVSFRLAPDLRKSNVPQKIRAMNKSSAMGVATLPLMLLLHGSLQVTDDLSLDEKYHQLGDVDRMIRQPLQILRNKEQSGRP